jgi:hypothetical protein
VNIKSNGHEHEFEAAYGLPEPLPKGEAILWQGTPDFADLAVRVFHMKKVTVYFLVLAGIRGFFLDSAGASVATIMVGMLIVLGLGLTALAALGILAALTARTTVYTLTDRRIVMRIGIVLTLTFNLPLNRIETAGLLLTNKGYGDIPLALTSGDRIGWLNLWPHARPWRLTSPEPMLRCIPDAQKFAALLQNTWVKVAGKHSDSMQLKDERDTAYWQNSSLIGKPV